MHPLDGARERLKRANESIQNLNGEVTRFLAPTPIAAFPVDWETNEPIMTDEYRQAYERLRDFILNAIIPPRFKVLTGEIIHHLRCAFDHIAWELSASELQAKSPTQIEFPIFLEEPDHCGIAKNKMSRYCRKVQGITSPTALTRIQRLQPYCSRNPIRDPLWLIHDMDRIDKHRELVVVACTGQLSITGNAEIPAVGSILPWEIKPRNVRIVGPPKVQMKGQLTAQISLGEFTQREDHPIIPTLMNLLNFTVDAVESFAPEFV